MSVALSAFIALHSASESPFRLWLKHYGFYVSQPSLPSNINILLILWYGLESMKLFFVVFVRDEKKELKMRCCSPSIRCHRLNFSLRVMLLADEKCGKCIHGERKRRWKFRKSFKSSLGGKIYLNDKPLCKKWILGMSEGSWLNRTETHLRLLFASSQGESIIFKLLLLQVTERKTRYSQLFFSPFSLWPFQWSENMCAAEIQQSAARKINSLDFFSSTTRSRERFEITISLFEFSRAIKTRKRRELWKVVCVKF